MTRHHYKCKESSKQALSHVIPGLSLSCKIANTSLLTINLRERESLRCSCRASPELSSALSQAATADGQAWPLSLRCVSAMNSFRRRALAASTIPSCAVRRRREHRLFATTVTLPQLQDRHHCKCKDTFSKASSPSLDAWLSALRFCHEQLSAQGVGCKHDSQLCCAAQARTPTVRHYRDIASAAR